MSKKVSWMVLMLVMLMAFGTSAFANHGKGHAKKHGKGAHHAKHGKGHHGKGKKGHSDNEATKAEGPAASADASSSVTSDAAPTAKY